LPRFIESHLIDGPAGKLEALLEEPEDRVPVEAVVLCHPHPLGGGTMRNKVVYRIARGLRRAGRAVLRFNFRGVGRSEGHHAHGVGEVEDARSALSWMLARYPELPYSLAGFSFGSRVILGLGCALPQATRLLAAGFPTQREQFVNLSECNVPKVFIQSTRDEFGPLPELRSFYETVAPPKELHTLEAEDHFFGGALQELEDLVFRLTVEEPAPRGE
jgi:uncharacterized protein